MTSPPLPLAGQRALILGLANDHSIAWGCARSLYRDGARLVLSCVNEKAAAVCAPLAASVSAPLLQCDVTRDGDVAALVQAAAEDLGGLDIVVHSIAWAPLEDLHGRFVDVGAEGFARAMHVSCHSFTEVARAAEPHLRAAGGGCLVTMSYLGAEGVVPHYGVMGPVKAALESAVRYLAAELGPGGTRVHAVSPGPISTRAASGLLNFDGLLAHARAYAPLRRGVTLDEIGDTVAFLCSPRASGLTGQTLYVDGGLHAIR